MNDPDCFLSLHSPSKLPSSSRTTLLRLVLEQLKAAGLQTFSKEASTLACTLDDDDIVLVGAANAQLESEAERIHMVKQMVVQTNAEKASFALSGVPPANRFRRRCRSRFQDVDMDSFFLSSERVLLVRSLLDSVPCGSDLADWIQDGCGCAHDKGTTSTPHPPGRYPASLSSSMSSLSSLGSGIGRRIQSSRFSRVLRSTTLPLKDQALVSALQSAGCEVVIGVLEDGQRKKALFHSLLRSVMTIPIHEVRAVYGDEVALYFAWLHCFTRWLVVPSLLGICMWIFRPEGVTVDDSPYLPFYGLAVVLWAHLFHKAWTRQCAELACQWGSLHLVDEDDDVRPGFHGSSTTSGVTGEPMLMYPAYKRIPAYALSVLVTVAMLCVALAVMVCSFNLQGYMGDRSSPFHVPWLHAFADPGGLFDPNGSNPLMPLVPVVLHSGVILGLNTLYRSVAQWLTLLENHRTISQHEDALILKRFLFDATDCYLPLFYLAFWRLDVQLLRAELVALFTTDSIRRVFLESILPFLMSHITPIWVWLSPSTPPATGSTTTFTFPSSSSSPRSSSSSPSSLSHSRITHSIAVAKGQINKEEYENFDDYLEMVVEFGYITLFASAFPLASVLSLVCNLIELRSDAFKLAFVARHPRPVRQSTIGTWSKLLCFMMWFSILTNCLIFGFASEQMGEWFPSLFSEVSEAYAPHGSPSPSSSPSQLEGGQVHHGATIRFNAGSGRYAVGLVFSLEHLLMVMALAIAFGVSDWPAWVRTEVARRLHEDDGGFSHEKDKKNK